MQGKCRLQREENLGCKVGVFPPLRRLELSQAPPREGGRQHLETPLYSPPLFRLPSLLLHQQDSPVEGKKEGLPSRHAVPPVALVVEG